MPRDSQGATRRVAHRSVQLVDGRLRKTIMKSEAATVKSLQGPSPDRAAVVVVSEVDHGFWYGGPVGGVVQRVCIVRGVHERV